MKPDQSQITHHNGGTTITGKDGMLLYRAVVLRSSLRLYARTGMKSTRAATPANMFAIAKEYTGKDYKRGEYDKAIADLDIWIATMKAGMPIEDARSPA